MGAPPPCTPGGNELFLHSGLVPATLFPAEKVREGKEYGDRAWGRQTSIQKSKHLFWNFGVSAQPRFDVTCSLTCSHWAGSVWFRKKQWGCDLFQSHHPSSTGNGRTVGFLLRPPKPEGQLCRCAVSHPRRLPSGDQRGRREGKHPGIQLGSPLAPGEGWGPARVEAWTRAEKGVTGWQEPEQMWVKWMRFNLAREVS